MPLTRAQMDTDMAACLIDLPEVVRHGNYEVPCARIYPARAVTARLRDVFADQYDLSVTAALSSWSGATPPAAGDTVQLLAEADAETWSTLRVLDVGYSPDRAQITLHLGDRYTAGG
jgi:hypothetical protein